MNKQQTTYTGISFGSALGLLFIGLKLGGIIDWSWWLVLSPFYFGILIAAALIAIAIVTCTVVGLCEIVVETVKQDKQRRKK